MTEFLCTCAIDIGHVPHMALNLDSVRLRHEVVKVALDRWSFVDVLTPNYPSNLRSCFTFLPPDGAKHMMMTTVLNWMATRRSKAHIPRIEPSV